MTRPAKQTTHPPRRFVRMAKHPETNRLDPAAGAEGAVGAGITSRAQMTPSPSEMRIRAPSRADVGVAAVPPADPNANPHLETGRKSKNSREGASERSGRRRIGVIGNPGQETQNGFGDSRTGKPLRRSAPGYRLLATQLGGDHRFD